MNEMMERVKGALRSVFQGEPVEVRTVCWVPECRTPPAMVLAGTEDGVIAGCRDHVRQWVASDACRVAADHGGRGMITALARWGEENGPYTALVSMRPRNDVMFLRHAAETMR